MSLAYDPAAEPVYFESLAVFGAWLAPHAGKASELIVGFHKRATGAASMTWPQSVDEALSHDWIDGVRKRIDDDSYKIHFTPRKPTSTWSAINIARVAALQSLNEGQGDSSNASADNQAQPLSRAYTRALRATVLWLLATLVLSGAHAGTQTELNRVVADVCDKDVVFLGEDSSHGSGHALEVKVDLVKRLVEVCKYSAVFFESQIYDFLELDRARKERHATPAQLLDAIGGLWSTTREIEPLVSYLFAKMASGEVTISGLDSQVGGATQLFTQRRLPEELTRYLDEPRRSACKQEIDRLTNWRFDSANPFDDATRGRLSGCVDDIEGAIAKRSLGENEATSKQMAINLGYYLKMTPRRDPGLRDRGMYKNFMWLRSRLPSSAKVIVWCATVHAVKEPLTAGGDPPMGALVHRLLGDRSAVIGFTAGGGSVARQGQPPRQIAPAPQDSLEARVLADSADQLRYAARWQLDELSTIEARPINLRTWRSAEWGRLLDGLIVLREERPPQYVRPAEPQQTPASL